MPITYDDARRQYLDALPEDKRSNPDEVNDFSNRWRKTDEFYNAQTPYGDNPVDRPGINDATQRRSWTDLFGEAKGDFASRFADDGQKGESGDGGGRDRALANVSQTYSGASNSLNVFLQQMQARDAAQQAERGQLRGILMSQLGGLAQPVSRDDPAMRGLFEGQRLSSQREAERQRSAAAEALGARGLSDSGAMDTTLLGLDENRAERNVQFEGQTLYQEMQNRRQALQSLLAQALQIGDNESARAIQAQLNTMQMQLGEGGRLDDLGYRYTALQAGLNSGALNPFVY